MFERTSTEKWPDFETILSIDMNPLTRSAVRSGGGKLGPTLPVQSTVPLSTP